MKSFDELLAMSDSEKDEYLRAEAEKVIAQASPNKVLKLRQLQARCDGIRRRVHEPSVAAGMVYGLMLDRLNELNVHLKN